MGSLGKAGKEDALTSPSFPIAETAIVSVNAAGKSTGPESLPAAHTQTVPLLYAAWIASESMSEGCVDPRLMFTNSTPEATIPSSASAMSPWLAFESGGKTRAE